ncbi:MAG: LemA family protein [Opitutaceae bacterium]|nr:LemA family protein [Verrucomicrobiales bacterium]
MKKSWIALGCLGVLLLIALIVVVFVGGSYNGMVARSQDVDKQWAQVQNVYQRRADLIPNLVSTVSGAANFEKSTLTEITEARASVGQVKIDPSQAPNDPAKLAEFQKTQERLSSALSRLLVVAERYPDLKATANFRDLQAQLEGTENRITVERQKFNESVQRYNTTVKSFPGVLMAGMFGFHAKPYFASKEGAETPPTVQFDFGGSKAAPAK